MTPRQLRLVAGPASVCNQGGETMLREEDAPYLFDSKDARKAQTDRLRRYVSLIKEEGLTGQAGLPAWQDKIARASPARGEHDNSTIIDSSFANGEQQQQQQLRQHGHAQFDGSVLGAAVMLPVLRWMEGTVRISTAAATPPYPSPLPATHLPSLLF